jgi:rubrerythrin
MLDSKKDSQGLWSSVRGVMLRAMKLQPELADLLRQAYSGEKAAAFAYIGHARSLRDPEVRRAVKQIEEDEWNHRREVLALMQEYGVPESRWYECKYHIIGRIISAACYVIGWFMPLYFAGRLESGNVCEYIVMKDYFNALGITKHDAILYEMAVKEREHEDFFQLQVKDSRLLPFFEKLFGWGGRRSFNTIDASDKSPDLAKVDAKSSGCRR